SESAVEQVLKKPPRDQQATYLLGLVAGQLGDYPVSAKLLESVSKLVNERPQSIIALANAYYRTERKQKAQKLLASLKTHSGGSQGVFMGALIALQVNDYELAEDLLSSIQTTYPDKAALNANLALVQFRSGRIS